MCMSQHDQLELLSCRLSNLPRLKNYCFEPFPSAIFPASNRHKQGELVACFSVFLLYLAWKKRDFLENLHVFSCFVQLKSVLFKLSSVLDLVLTASWPVSKLLKDATIFGPNVETGVQKLQLDDTTQTDVTARSRSH